MSPHKTKYRLGYLIIVCCILLVSGAIVFRFPNRGSDQNNPLASQRSVAKITLEKEHPNKSQLHSRHLELGIITGRTDKLDREESVIMNDPALKQAWGIEKANALKAWRITQGSEKLVVAVIDTGCDLKHEDLADNYWTNPGEIRDGKDNDGNGFVDDIHGWNFVSNNNDLTDNHGHGTHVAGIIGAIANNGKGLAGVSPKVRLMCLKYYDPKNPSDHLKNTIKAIQYAIKMKAHIINYSGGGIEPSAEEQSIIEAAQNQGILFVAAAGNERSNSDIHKYYPADYGLENIISVTAIDPSNSILPSSNYGTQTVDLAAPGHNILSTLPGSTYGFMTGTSQATAFVSGAAVLVWSRHPHFAYHEVKRYILQTGTMDENLLKKTRTARVLNLLKALTMMDNTLTLTGLSGPSTQPISSDNPFSVDSQNPFKPFIELNIFSKKLQEKSIQSREASQPTNQ
ncbi:MAG: S8 family serine peptidase [Bdellovibrionaceae bacterium]|nr:S8 family serine peptidase [Pseudobdellovibrionaceae bacterium]MDW8189847.1 S8 family peptidase [Pseudobdellovibrionaceae bacterium]